MEKGADINQASTDDWTSLYVAAWHGRLDVVELLMCEGADISKDQYYRLQEATIKGHLGIVRLLIQKGARVNRSDNSGRIPLYIAAEEGYLELVTLLIEKGSDI